MLDVTRSLAVAKEIRVKKKVAHPAYLNAYKASFKAATGRDYDTMMAHPEKAKQDKGEAA